MIAATLQVQTTLPMGATGIRVSVADLIAPFALAALVVRSRGIEWPVRRDARVLLALLLAASLWLAAAIIHGRLRLGAWESWAVANRGLGWILLLTYAGCGWLCAWRGGEAALRATLRAFVIVFWISVAVSFVVFVAHNMQWLGSANVAAATATPLQETLGLVTAGSRFQGLVANPAAFGLMAAIVVAIHLAHAGERPLRRPAKNWIGLTIALLALTATFSRTAWIGAAAGVLSLVVLGRVSWRPLLVAGMVGTLAAFLLVWSFDQQQWHPATEMAANSVAAEAEVRSVTHRLSIAGAAIELWRGSPIVGAGVGSFLAEQVAADAGVVATIHSSYLWLAAETGLVGLALVSAFFVGCVVFLWRSARSSGAAAAVAVAAIAILAGAALAMDALYQRPLWFFLGLGLASAALNNRAGARLSS